MSKDTDKHPMMSADIEKSETSIGNFSDDAMKKESDVVASTDENDIINHRASTPQLVADEGEEKEEEKDIALVKPIRKQKTIRKSKASLKKYRCTLCSKWFKQQNHLTLHMILHKKGDSGGKSNDKQSNCKSYQCQICQEPFSTKYNLKVHTVSVHLGMRPYQCPYCPLRFTQRGNCEQHKQRKHDTQKIEVTSRPVEFRDNDNISTLESALPDQLKSESIGKGYRCQTCGKRFKVKETLEKHAKKHEASTDEPEKTTACSASHSKNLNKTTGDFKCLVCGKVLANHCSLQRHHRTTHLGTYRHVCPVCGKGFSDKRPINKHMQVMHSDYKGHFPKAHSKKTPGKTHEQEMAKKNSSERGMVKNTLNTKTHLQNNQQIKKNLLTGHSECTICNKAFRFAYSVRLHIQAVHLNLRPYACETCGKTFALKETLKRHQKALHGTGADTTLNTKTHVQINQRIKKNLLTGHSECTICNKAFRFAYSARFHIQAVHLNLRPYACKTCGKTFALKETRKRHQKSLHGADTSSRPLIVEKSPKHLKKKYAAFKRKLDKDVPTGFQCRFCGTSFRLKWNCRRHERALHSNMHIPLSPIRSKGFSITGKYTKTQNDHMAKPYKCLLCGKAFTVERKYMIHNTLHHLKKAGQHSKGAIVKHPVRHKNTPLKKEYKKHQKFIADKDKPYSCTTCGKGFKWKNNYKRHQKFEHPMVPQSTHTSSTISSSVDGSSERSQKLTNYRDIIYTCPVCDKTFLNKEDCQIHQKHQYPEGHCHDSTMKTENVLSCKGNAMTTKDSAEDCANYCDTTEMKKLRPQSCSDDETVKTKLPKNRQTMNVCQDEKDANGTEKKTSVDVSGDLKEAIQKDVDEEKAMAGCMPESNLLQDKLKQLPTVFTDAKEKVDPSELSDDDYGFEYDDDGDDSDCVDTIEEETSMTDNTSTHSKELSNDDKSQQPSSSRDTSSHSFSSSVPEPEWVYHCPACFKGFELSIDLVMHIKSHMDQRNSS